MATQHAKWRRSKTCRGALGSARDNCGREGEAFPGAKRLCADGVVDTRGAKLMHSCTIKPPVLRVLSRAKAGQPTAMNFSATRPKIISGLLVWALLLAGCSREATTTVASSAAVPVQVAVAQRLDVPRVIESIGNVQSLRTVAIKSQVDGIIAEIHFREGDDVKAGDLLVTLDRRPFENSARFAQCTERWNA